MNKTILVTGASKGIGRAIAERLGRDNFRIVVHYGQDHAGAAETLSMIQKNGSDGRLISFDIADREACKTVIEQDIETHGPLYGVVLNAGITDDAAFPAMEGGAWDRVLRTNLDGFYNVLHPIILPMVSARKGGRVVVMSSVSGVVGNRGQTNYSATKAGLIGAAKSLAVELAKRKITVNCVAPGLIDTGMLEGLPLDKIMDAIPLRRVGTVAEVAGAVSFLCSDEASYITRQVLSVNGGMA